MGMRNDQLMDQEWQRIAWLCVDKQARELLARPYETSSEVGRWLDDIDESRLELSVLVNTLHATIKAKTTLSTLDVEEMVSGRFDVDVWQGLVKALKVCSNDEVFERAVAAKIILEAALKEPLSTLIPPTAFTSYVKRGSEDADYRALKASLGSLNSLLLVAPGADDEEADGGLTESLVNWVQDTLDHARKTEKCLQRSVGSGRLSSLVDSLIPEPRSSIAESLFGSSPMKDPAIRAPQQLFELMRETVVISRSDWFELYRRAYGGHRKVEDTWAFFALGIYDLLFMGLIRERPATARSDHLYEKVSVVWTSGR